MSGILGGLGSLQGIVRGGGLGNLSTGATDAADSYSRNLLKSTSDAATVSTAIAGAHKINRDTETGIAMQNVDSNTKTIGSLLSKMGAIQF